MSQNPWQDRQPPPEDRPPSRPPPGSEEPTRADGVSGYPPPPPQGRPSGAPQPGAAPPPGSWPPPPGARQQPGPYTPPGTYPPGYGAPQQQPYYGVPPPRPASHLVWAIISIILFWPLGIAAVIFAAQVNSKYEMGDYAGAADSSSKARLFSLIATIIAAIGIVLFIVFAALTASWWSDYNPGNGY
ncbi:CD225/dispanin family protein [Streptomyces sp. C36]|uniref:CD225/dispanin family protein n=1 Tax=Streptomyces sp. C36 TaxID=3237122 RepID=UPI0034C69956